MLNAFHALNTCALIPKISPSHRNCRAGRRKDAHSRPGQRILLETIYAQEISGDAATLLPGAALQGFRGVQPVRPRGLVQAITLGFDEETVVYANTGVLFHCPAVGAEQGQLSAVRLIKS